MSPVISLDGAGKVFGSITALDAVSATIHPGAELHDLVINR